MVIIVLNYFLFQFLQKRPSKPQATGLRHLAFEETDLEKVIAHLNQYEIEEEPTRIDEIIDKQFTFTQDPDVIPIEFYEK